jgi:Flp pilus assembly protein TadG
MSHQQAANFLRCNVGASAVEFALVAPLLLALMLGTVALGSFLGFAHSLQTAASESARAAVAGLDSAERTAIATEAAQRNIASSLLLRANAVVIDARPDAANPDVFTVTLSYDLNTTLLAVIPRIVPMPQTLTRSASIRRGGL